MQISDISLHRIINRPAGVCKYSRSKSFSPLLNQWLLWLNFKHAELEAGLIVCLLLGESHTKAADTSIHNQILALKLLMGPISQHTL